MKKQTRKGSTHGGEPEPRGNSSSENRGHRSRDELRNRQMEDRVRDAFKGTPLSND